jgi:hypothetical protein
MSFRVEERDAGTNQRTTYVDFDDRGFAEKYWSDLMAAGRDAYEANGRYRLVLLDLDNHVGGAR